MPSGPRCTVCDHPERKAIETAMAVASVRDIGRRFGLSKSAVHGHKQRHLSPAVARAASTRADVSAQALLDRLTDLLERCDSGMEKAEKGGDFRAVAGFVREARELVVTLGRAAHGLWTQKPSTYIDARSQTVNLGELTIDELRSLARLAPSAGEA